MKKIYVFFILLLLISSCATGYVKFQDNDSDAVKIEKAEKFATNFLQKLKNGDSYEFSNEAIDELVQKLTPELQKNVYNDISSKFGQFVRLEYGETWGSKKKNEFEIIRLKGYFEKSTNPLEIRVVFNEANKIAGFWIKPWKENLN